MKQKKTIVVDEAVSEDICDRFLAFLEKKGYTHLTTLFIAREYSGMPDSQILHHLLDRNTIFLTSDRPFHNKVLSEGLQSYYVNREGVFRARKLPGMKLKDNYTLHKHDLELKEQYRLPKTEIRPCLLPSSEKSLKKLRTKRRRIRNHFGGQEHLDQVAITVSWTSRHDSTLFGIRLRISSNIGIRALDASESYIRESLDPESRNLAALNYALILAIQLMLHSVKTQVYYDSPAIGHPSGSVQKAPQSPQAQLFAELSKNFPSIEFIPSTKGRFIEGLRKKLDSLSKSDSNELTRGNISEILSKVQNFRAESAKEQTERPA